MVFNWFERQAPSPGEPPSTPDSPEVEQQPPANPVQVKPEPDHLAPQDDVEQKAEEPEDEALVWAREAYARLKEQQQAAASAPTTPVSTSPEPKPEPTPEPTLEPIPAPTVGGSLLEQAAAQRQQTK